MPSGLHLNKITRELIYHHMVHLGRTAKQIFAGVFGESEDLISESYLCRICSDLDHMTLSERQLFVSEPNRRGGGHFKMDAFEQQYFLSLVREQRTGCLQDIYNDFINEFYGDHPEDAPHTSTGRRVAERAGFTRKIIERRHVNINPQERLAFMERVAFVQPHQWVDIDETASSSAQHREKYGYAPKGEKAMRTQFRIGGRHFSAIAAYTIGGFLCWNIVEGSFGSDQFQTFLRNTLAPLLLSGQCLLVDNAKIHKTQASLATLDAVSGGKYECSPTYSPDLKPVELGFSNVKRYVRKHEQEALADPIGFLNNAFERFSVRSAHGYECKHFCSLMSARANPTNQSAAAGHWNFYQRNHELFLQEIASGNQH